MAHGKKSTLWFETTPGAASKPPVSAGTGYNKLTKASSFSIAIMKDIADSSVIDSENHTSEAGQQGGSISAPFRFKQSEYLALDANFRSDTPTSFIARPGGDTIGQLQMYADYHISELSLSGSNGDVVNGTLTAQRTGPVYTVAIAS